MAKPRTRFVCSQCGTETVRWQGRCPGCGAWNTMVEEKIPAGDGSRPRGFSAFTSGPAVSPAGRPVPLDEVESVAERRLAFGIGEFDRILGGGLVPGSLVLVGGDPGIGKSTLLLQSVSRLADQVVIYVSAEESAKQVRLRAERLGVEKSGVLVLAETDLDVVTRVVEENKPGILVIDSIQAVFLPVLESAPGSLSQVRECGARLMYLSKGSGMTTLLIGHVTKDGSIAGPRTLEHMVDTVLYLEGERHHNFRILRAVKNRFGSTNEIGIFEMTLEGLREVLNPSEIFLSDRSVPRSGSVVVASLEGTRPLLVELQALVGESGFGTPQRVSAGFDRPAGCGSMSRGPTWGRPWRLSPACATSRWTRDWWRSARWDWGVRSGQ